MFDHTVEFQIVSGDGGRAMHPERFQREIKISKQAVSWKDRGIVCPLFQEEPWRQEVPRGEKVAWCVRVDM